MSNIVTTERVYGCIRSPYVRYLRDAPQGNERLEFHVRSGDYFAMLATALGFVEEELLTCKKESPEGKLLKELKRDLIHLHKYYRIHKAEQETQFQEKTIHRFK